MHAYVKMLYYIKCCSCLYMWYPIISICIAVTHVYQTNIITFHNNRILISANTCINLAPFTSVKLIVVSTSFKVINCI